MSICLVVKWSIILLMSITDLLNQNKYQFAQAINLVSRCATSTKEREVNEQGRVRFHNGWCVASKIKTNIFADMAWIGLLFAMLLFSVLEKYLLVVFMWVDDGLFLYIIVKSVHIRHYFLLSCLVQQKRENEWLFVVNTFVNMVIVFVWFWSCFCRPFHFIFSVHVYFLYVEYL